MSFRKELKILEIPKWGKYLRKSWENTFANHLTNAEKDSIYLDSFLWHLCSWGATNCAVNMEAVELFKNQHKKKCAIFYQFIEEAYLIEDAKSLVIEDLPHDRLDMYYGDIYVLDWEGKWTFIMTHEKEYGPYFIMN